MQETVPLQLFSQSRIFEAQKEKDESEKGIENLLTKKQELTKQIANLKTILQNYEHELPKYNSVIDKQEYVKKLVEEEKILKEEINDLINRRSSLEKKAFFWYLLWRETKKVEKHILFSRLGYLKGFLKSSLTLT